jgi:hypothetical protein
MVIRFTPSHPNFLSLSLSLLLSLPIPFTRPPNDQFPPTTNIKRRLTPLRSSFSFGITFLGMRIGITTVRMVVLRTGVDLNVCIV